MGAAFAAGLAFFGAFLGTLDFLATLDFLTVTLRPRADFADVAAALRTFLRAFLALRLVALLLVLRLGAAFLAPTFILTFGRRADLAAAVLVLFLVFLTLAFLVLDLALATGFRRDLVERLDLDEVLRLRVGLVTAAMMVVAGNGFRGASQRNPRKRR
ncbi:MAG: hypothetical protein WCA36_15660 [Pseudolabrys sp.]